MSVVEEHRRVWEEKKILRDVYGDWYERIVADLAGVPGETFELGAGSGNFKEFKRDSVSSDIGFYPWLDTCFDALHMPLKDNCAANVVLIDVLHHLANPIQFFKESARILNTGGRIILLEPFPSPFSLFFYKRFHPEPFLMNIDYFNDQCVADSPNSPPKDPWDANQAMAYLLFFKHKQKFMNFFKSHFKITKQKKLSCILYPASGGFENKAMIPDALIPLFKAAEFLLTPLRPLMAFRCYIVLEKISA